tara:strand:- start:1872 stop:2858 length:987 start_codon:yes stop_codon:yes gene_type:complete
MKKIKTAHFRANNCLNCKTSLDISERFCHQCGQLNSTKKLTFRSFFEEFFSVFYAYDSKIKNSLVSMYTKPGVLAKEYTAGMRQKYVNPFRLFLSVCFLLFLSGSFVVNKNIKVNATSASTSNVTEENIANDSIYVNKELGIYKAFDFTNKLRSFKNYQIKNPIHSNEKALRNLGFKTSNINKLIFEKTKSFKTNRIEEELRAYFGQNLSFFIFISLPFFSIIFIIAYPIKNINYTEHLVFSYSFFTFIVTCGIFFNIINYFISNLLNIIFCFCFLIIFPYYFYRSLRNFYGQTRWKTILKFVLLNALFIPFSIFSFLLIVLIGIVLI